jgi:hypothetical protein
MAKATMPVSDGYVLTRAQRDMGRIMDAIIKAKVCPECKERVPTRTRPIIGSDGEFRLYCPECEPPGNGPVPRPAISANDQIRIDHAIRKARLRLSRLSSF